MIATSTCWTLGLAGLRFLGRRSLRSAAAALAATGSAATLADVVEYYDHERDLKLDAAAKHDLVEYLLSL